MQITPAARRKGIRIERGRDVDVLEAISVGEVMDTQFLPFKESTLLEDASAAMLDRRTHGALVVDDEGELCGILPIRPASAIRWPKSPGPMTASLPRCAAAAAS